MSMVDFVTRLPTFRGRDDGQRAPDKEDAKGANSKLHSHVSTFDMRNAISSEDEEKSQV